ncbi:Multidrug resistance-associated protein 4 [Stylophora pistillata]|uniref:Multidrug resistance-associated protein 4 n=1 Tax=Stylophora pistillata TaxID=50429 RepID=A0A2B4S337_STYPI|nr:Multidrug resistance-associated protein 4 [Stylophora pistillata]
MDDPVIAVDFKVGQHIFNKCIRGVLGDKIALLTSHQQQHMGNADEVIVLYKGRDLDRGHYIELYEEGVMSSSVDSPYTAALKDKEETSDTFVWKNTEKHKDADAKGLEMAKEDRTIGIVTSKLYWDYFRSEAHPLMITGMVGLCLFTNYYILMLFVSAVIVAPDLWLSFLAKLPPEDQKNKTYLTVLACLFGTCFIFTMVRAFGFFHLSLRCARRLHNKMVVAILQAPVLFFDSNPVGRILNRFSNDIGCVDELLSKTFLWAMQMLLLIFAQILVTVATNFWLVFLVVPISVLVVFFSKYYLKTARELKRLESISRSPVFAHFSETLIRLDMIRTRGRQTHFWTHFTGTLETLTRDVLMEPINAPGALIPTKFTL